MAKKKTTSKEPDEKPKPIDRTQIIVAMIGLIGTLAVALITVFANRPVENPAATTSTIEEVGVTESPTIVQNNETCFDDYFASIPADNRLDLSAGISTRLPDSEDGKYGIRLFDNGVLLGGLQFVGASDTQSFDVISVVDANCTPVSDFGNIERSNAGGAIANWENLGLSITGVEYRLRMGWYGNSQIELVFQED